MRESIEVYLADEQREVLSPLFDKVYQANKESQFTENTTSVFAQIHDDKIRATFLNASESESVRRIINREYSLEKGNACVVGDIDIVEDDHTYSVKRCLVIEFKTASDCKAAIDARKCEFTFLGGD